MDDENNRVYITNEGVIVADERNMVCFADEKFYEPGRVQTFYMVGKPTSESIRTYSCKPLEPGETGIMAGIDSMSTTKGFTFRIKGVIYITKIQLEQLFLRREFSDDGSRILDMLEGIVDSEGDKEIS